MAERYVEVVEPSDNVATLLRDAEAGEAMEIPVDETGGNVVSVTLQDDVGFGHKVALRDIREGETIVKYGKSIGNATEDIPAGEWIHVHNVESNYGRGDLEQAVQESQ
jgi:altronate dehydratase small subunit